MIRATSTVAIAFVCCTAAGTEQLPVTVVSPCKCRDAHDKGRWTVKNDPATPPTDVSAIQAVTTSDVFGWPGLEGHLNGNQNAPGARTTGIL